MKRRIAVLLLIAPACQAQNRIFSVSATANQQYSFSKQRFDTDAGASFDYWVDKHVRLALGYSRNLTTADNKVSVGLSVRLLNFGRKRD